MTTPKIASHDLVSIIIVTFNEASYLATDIKAVLKQTHGNLELIIVDDGSTDASLEIAQQFQDPRIKIVQNKKIKASHTAVTSALNEARVSLCFSLMRIVCPQKTGLKIACRKWRQLMIAVK